ncbi:MAG: class I SAM-dependent methyltransferase [Phaeovulum sp.]|uniref:SAM-dependent methyltransferase n=1 Tax=Phaeovulum sp. TaxID=2934796 RepID=UPI00272EF11C|nr:class I SAM-dependent methyltransferase [Phaeovulum sp.]MDP2063327.1 class I SAM-dependent methyltransferase [Phaeovulum sp.]
MNSGWNERFAGAGYLFGTAPAAFVARLAPRLAPGSRLLSVAEGEGRNAAHLAGLGHHVTAFDSSETALAKARALAEGITPAPAFHLARIEDWQWQADAFDAVFGVFIQFAPPALRDRIFTGMAQTLRPGGRVLLHGFAPRQLGNRSGGPRAPAQLYTLELLRAAFPGWQIEHAADYDADLDEGEGHQGRAALVDFVARKP